MRSLLSKDGLRLILVLILIMWASYETTKNPHSGLVDRLESFLSDTRLNVPAPGVDPNVVIVDIDEKSIAAIGHWPWGRNVIADLVTQLTGRYKARAVGFDIMFSEPDTSSGYASIDALAKNELKDIPQFRKKVDLLKPTLDYDERLAKAIQGKPVVLGFFLDEPPSVGQLPKPAFSVDDLDGHALSAVPRPSYKANLAQFQQAAMAEGYFNGDIDPDGQLRSYVLLAQIGDSYYESLALATARIALDATRVRPVFPKDVAIISNASAKEYGVAEAIAINTAPRMKKIPVEDGLKMNIYFRGRGGPHGGGFNYFSAVDVIKGRVPVEALGNKIVLIGTTAIGVNDIRATPVSAEFPGVEIHANIVASILDGKIKHKPDFSLPIDLFQILVLGLILGITLPRLTPTASIVLVAGVTACVGGFNYWMYQSFNQILPIATALFLILGLFIVNVFWGYWFEYRNGRLMVNLFGEYVAPELVAEMASDPEAYNMEGENRELTVLFVDVRGFTTISEGLEPKPLREYINIYLTAMSEDIRGNRGTLDKYIGDAVMAFWGAPVALPDHSARAVETALKMQATAHVLNLDFIKRGWPPLKIGIGLNTGQMHVGDMGSKIRRAYTVMGDAVNLASRLEGITKAYGVGIVVGEGTKLAAADFAYRELDFVRVKGKNEPVPIFEPIGRLDALDEAAKDALAKWHSALAAVRAMQWDAAETILRQLQGDYPDDKLYGIYLERIAKFRANPPGAGWDGVTNFDTK